jgi:hypothetical protein
MADKDVVSKSQKRTQIASANRNVFFIVAGASLIVGFCIVGSIFLVQQIAFRAKVIGEAQETVSTLESNITNIETLETRVRALGTHNRNLMYVAQGEDMSALRSIADALPVVDNPAALGARISDKIFGFEGVRLESLRISTSNRQSISGPSPSVSAVPSTTALTTDFDFRITSNDGELGILAALRNIELSIRTIDIESFKLSFSSRLELSAKATAYHTNPVITVLSEKTWCPESIEEYRRQLNEKN